jgi:DNA-binding MarR family transcriptional regulator
MSEKLNFEKISAYDTPKKSPGFLLWHISTSWRGSIEFVLKGWGLTHPQFVVLATVGWLTKNGSLVTQVVIGKMAGLDPNTNSQIIKGLEQKELIQRVQSSDGRAKNVSLTPSGSNILNQALPAVEKADSHFFNLLSTKELQLLTQTFQKLMPKSVTD